MKKKKKRKKERKRNTTWIMEKGKNIMLSVLIWIIWRTQILSNRSTTWKIEKGRTWCTVIFEKVGVSP
jgi:hypothetical protein